MRDLSKSRLAGRIFRQRKKKQLEENMAWLEAAQKDKTSVLLDDVVEKFDNIKAISDELVALENRVAKIAAKEENVKPI